ncbi:MAG TPA: NAD(P)/FAD-dependent oxidoreductase [Gordonia sp. (in: high G+C Gram-positive bacteria)]|uniref:flavin-containing monooxygenase n=3 Tax=Gordonia TaxID=2053 RepID=UPI0025B960AE|nr:MULTISPECIES: NAD(P)/FAD-dependent oxidoreductase [unclassified Gordonia (in: high G+C Gram-positive bacteria)]HNP55524.1 NAD(P)/FAD-dependent oxidoreductase [Gordonia sp. (in: high G+C Gram-positive bacteria)]HRC51341.1 NAD(P)/FAD-dependent oxidoreductase [Gordonia sp. (in: high G+C Gram-positive bacteria)]
MSSTAKPKSDTTAETSVREVDVVIIGAGISGVGMGCRLIREHPELTFRILDRRARVGGTWDLFRYPGVRSDSDMYTFGYDFRPWTDAKILVDGPSIRQYLQDTADDYDLSDKIDHGITVVSADWSSTDGRWTIAAVNADGEEVTYLARFYVGATGYYDHEHGYRPAFPNEEAFTGTIVHPQHWPDDLDYAGKRVAVIGSGATAVTLIPNMAEEAEHITMIQRSPTYILAMPSENLVMKLLAEKVPPMVAYRLVRTLAVGFGRLSFDILRTFPRASKKALVALTARQLGPTIDIKHFTPRYNPWDERMCVVPDGDLFSYLRKGKASVVTDTIAEFTPTGVRMDSGEHVDADIIVTATGLNVLFNGGITMTVDGEPVDPAQHLTYKAVMLEGVPNAAFILGYTNASWTLKADLAAQYVCRLLTHMSRHGYTTVVAQADAGEPIDGTIFGSLTSGYVQRAADQLPKQGTRGAWKVTHDYIADQRLLGRCSIADEALVFGRAPAARRAAPARKRRASV